MVGIFTALLTLLGFSAGGGGNGGGATGGPPKRPRRGNGATDPVTPPVVPVAPPIRIDTTRLAFPSELTAGMSVRILQIAAGQPAQMDGLGGRGKTPADARAALGKDASAYFDLCLAARIPFPSQSVATERSNDAVYRARIRRAMMSDLDLWERALLRSKRARDEALEANLPVVPPPLILPQPVLDAIAARNAAREAERNAVKGGRAAAAGGGAPPPTAVQGSKHRPAGGPQR